LLTRQGYAELETELAALKSKRLDAIDEVRRAAADKDFRENVPLEAAREQRGQLEGRILKLEGTLKSAVVMDEKRNATLRVSIGDSVILRDLDSGKEMRYTLVSPREVDPTRGKVSSASPIGQAVIGRGQGEIVEVVAPAGKLRYQIKQVEH
jgi:transcription elongation factor GreA